MDETDQLFSYRVWSILVKVPKGIRLSLGLTSAIFVSMFFNLDGAKYGAKSNMATVLCWWGRKAEAEVMRATTVLRVPFQAGEA